MAGRHVCAGGRPSCCPGASVAGGEEDEGMGEGEGKGEGDRRETEEGGGDGEGMTRGRRREKEDGAERESGRASVSVSPLAMAVQARVCATPPLTAE